MGSVPVADLLSRLLQMEGGQGQPSCFLGNKHVLCWGYEDMLSAMEKDRIAKGVGDHERGGWAHLVCPQGSSSSKTGMDDCMI